MTDFAPASGAEAEETGRAHRQLSAAERRVRRWVKENYGVLSEIARELDPPMTVQSVYHVAYNLRRSKGLRAERELKARGCPLIQKIS